MNPKWVLEGTKKDASLLVYDIEFDVAPYLKLPKTVDEFHKMHKRKFWYNINRGEKLFISDFGGLDFIVTSEKDLLLLYLPKIQELFAMRWKKSHTSFDWKTKSGFQKYQEAMIDLASTGNGEIALLVNNQTVLAFGYSLLYDRNHYFFQHAVIPDPRYRKYSLGKILIRHLIESTIQKNFEVFDFMTGDQGYKREWANGEKKVYIRVSEDKSILGILNFLFKIMIYKIRSFIHHNKKFESYLKKILKLVHE